MKIAFYVVGRSRRAQIGLRTSGPTAVLRHGAVCKAHRFLLVKAFRVQIIIPILVMNAEQVSAGMHRIDKLLHSFPASGLLTGRKIIRMLIVIAGFRPSVQMQIELFYAPFSDVLNQPRPFCERCHMIVFFRLFLIIKIGKRMHIGLDSAVDKSAAIKLLHRRKSGRLFPQRNQLSGLLYISTVNAAQIIVITVIQKRIGGASSVIHFPQARLPPDADMSVRSSCGMVHIRPRIPGRIRDGDIAVSLFYLAEPGHIAAGRQKLSAKAQTVHCRLPVIGKQKALSLVDQRIPSGNTIFFLSASAGRSRSERHGNRPADLFYGKVFLADGNPLKMYLSHAALLRSLSGLFDPAICIKGIGILFPVKRAVAGSYSPAIPGFHRLMADFFPSGKIQLFLRRNDDRTDRAFRFPLCSSCRNADLKCLFAQADRKPGNRSHGHHQ